MVMMMMMMMMIIIIMMNILMMYPRGDAGGLSREYVLRVPACRKRRLKGRRYIAIVADTA